MTVLDEKFLEFIRLGSALIWQKKDLTMKKNGVDVDECCYEEMSGKVGGQSQPQEYWNDPMRNSYENGRKGWNQNGYDQSGMKGK